MFKDKPDPLPEDQLKHLRQATIPLFCRFCGEKKPFALEVRVELEKENTPHADLLIYCHSCRRVSWFLGCSNRVQWPVPIWTVLTKEQQGECPVFEFLRKTLYKPPEIKINPNFPGPWPSTEHRPPSRASEDTYSC